MEANANDTVKVYEKGGCKSIVPVIPTDNRILLRLSYLASLIEIRTVYENPKAKMSSNEKVSYTIVGIGNRVDTFEIGDEVLVAVQPDLIINVPTNNRDLMSLGAQLSKLDRKEYDEIIRSGSKWEVVEYGIFSSFQVAAIISK